MNRSAAPGLVLVVALLLGSCSGSTYKPPAETPAPRPAAARPPAQAPSVATAPPAPTPQALVRFDVAPAIRIAISLGTTSHAIRSDAGLRVQDDEGRLLQATAPGQSGTASVVGGNVTFEGPAGRVARRTITVSPQHPDSGIEVAGRSYSGELVLAVANGRLQVVNRLGLEDYLVGVVHAEMGKRPESDLEALKAQAIASRTFALRNAPRWRESGYDLPADQSAQVYKGRSGDDLMARRAVQETRGMILTAGGQPIDAFYSSTCGGHTEVGTAVFPGAARSYLIAQPDIGPDGTAWCAISPRYHWREEWSAGQLEQILKVSLAREGLSIGGTVRDLNVISRNATGRVTALAVSGGGGGRAVVQGAAIRRVLAPPRAGELLRSNGFTLRISRSGGRLEKVTAQGSGAGHGVGMCQWGAIGRSRAGHDHVAILMSYFPGTTLERSY